MDSKARKIIEEIKRFDHVQIVTHIDADGISAGAIACETLNRAGIEWDIEFVKQLDPDTIKRIGDKNPDIVWFTDLGSGYKNEISQLHAVITDHHTPQGGTGDMTSPTGSKSITTAGSLYAFEKKTEPAKESCMELELNPHNFGIDGAVEMSGAGVTYWLSKTWDDANKDIAWLAILGATGDLQDMRSRKFVGKNREILEDGKDAGCIHWEKDLYLFGRETRPLHKTLKYSNDPRIPGLGSERACIDFLSSLGVPLKNREEWRSWVDFSKKEKQKVVSALVKKVLRGGATSEKAIRLIGEVYTLPKEEPGTELHDTKEFATLLNACGRYGNARVGLDICLGDRGAALEKARDLLYNHRRYLVESIKVIMDQEGVTELDMLQYFHGRDIIMDSVIGTVASMILNSGNVNHEKPIFGFAETDEGMLKVSGRGTKKLVDSGLDLSELMGLASKEIGGAGGGHNVAAGATIPPGSEERFLAVAEQILRKQLES